MAPEIWKEPTRLSQAADIFALGATFYYMMVGHHLFQEAAYILRYEILLEFTYLVRRITIYLN